MIHGRNLIISLNGEAIAAAKAVGVHFESEFIKICSPIDGRFDDYRSATVGWSVSAECLCRDMTAYDQFLELMSNGSRVEVRLYDPTLGVNRHGSAYVNMVDMNSAALSLVKVKVELKGAGKLFVDRGASIPIMPTQTVFDTVLFYSSVDGVSILSEDGEHVYMYGLNITSPSRVWLFTSAQEGCAFIHKNEGTNVLSSIISTGNVAAFMNPSRMLCQVHGKDGMNSVILQPGSYWITWCPAYGQTTASKITI